MKIAFLGKGGSGKSTLATHAVRYLHALGYSVLAIDVDHNMDLSYNLGATGAQPFLGSNPGDIKRHIGVNEGLSFADALAHGASHGTHFGIDPIDAFTARVSVKLDDKLLLMTAGPHTDAVRFGGDCSHSLSAPLKAYLPLLAVGPHQAVVIDERAGTDPVATGILAGVDKALIVIEPTIHSVRVACQIAGELSHLHVPHAFVANKTNDQNDPIYDSLPHVPIAAIPFSRESTAIEIAMRRLFPML